MSEQTRASKSPPTLATLGPAGTHSEAAARLYARANWTQPAVILYGPPRDCLAMVGDSRADAAVLPAENVIDGLIGPTFDSLIDCSDEIKAYDQVILPVHHVLAGRLDADSAQITTIFSHPSALNQCARCLADLAPEARFVPLGSTAEAAWHVAQDAKPGAAAVCSEEAALAAGLSILDGDIGDFPDNQTRFIVCGRRISKPTGDDASLVAVHYGEDRPGQLYQTAGAFAAHGIDLCSVHSRPFRGRPRQYVLLFELLGHIRSLEIPSVLAEIEALVAKTGGWVKVLGSYPARREGS